MILKMFLHLDLSPPVVNSIDWTWFGKTHICLSTGHEVEGTACRSQRQDPEEGYKKKKVMLHLRSPRAKRLPWFLTGRSSEQPRLFLKRTEQSEERVLGKRGDEEPDGPSKDPVWRWEKLPEGQPSVQHSTNLGFVWPDESLKDARFKASCLQETRHSSSPAQYHPSSEAWRRGRTVRLLQGWWKTQSCLLTVPHPAWQSLRRSADKNVRKSPSPDVQRVRGLVTRVLKTILVIICNVSQHPADGALHL